MVEKAISKMKLGKAAALSGIEVEMIRAAGDTGATIICDLVKYMCTTITGNHGDDKVPTDWEQSFIACLYKGKSDALDRGD